MKHFAHAPGRSILGFLALAASISPAAFAVGCSSDDNNNNTVTPDGGGTTDAGEGDAGGGDSGSTPAGETDPIQAKAGEWTWVDFPNSACANGEPTGIGVNLGTSKEVFIYLEGGGACWDDTTCYTLGTASNVKDSHSFGEADLAKMVDPTGHNQFSRTTATNPFKDMSFVYVPYCTGDVHGGDNVVTTKDHVTHFVGGKNIQAFLKRIAPTFKDASRVVFGGSSAGGFGAAINFWRAQEAFGDIRVDLVDDSGPPMDQKYINLFTAWNTAWNLQNSFPANCADCKTNVDAVLPYYAKTYPKSRLALLSYIHDPTITNFFQCTTDQFNTGLNELATNQIDPTTNAKYFYVDGNSHTVLYRMDSVESKGTQLATWLSDMLTDKSTWASVKP